MGTVPGLETQCNLGSFVLISLFFFLEESRKFLLLIMPSDEIIAKLDWWSMNRLAGHSHSLAGLDWRNAFVAETPPEVWAWGSNI